MNSRDFCYWLQGFFELSDTPEMPPGTYQTLTSGQMTTIKNHLAMVFKTEIDPTFGPAPMQSALDHLHGKVTPGGATMRC